MYIDKGNHQYAKQVVKAQRRKALGFFLFIAVGFISIGIWFNQNNPPIQFEQYTVQTGDSVWTISKKSNLVKTNDIRDVVGFVIDLNDLDQEGTIHPDQKIMIPQIQ